MQVFLKIVTTWRRGGGWVACFTDMCAGVIGRVVRLHPEHPSGPCETTKAYSRAPAASGYHVAARV